MLGASYCESYYYYPSHKPIFDFHLALADSFTGMNPSSSEELCKFFAQGFCRYGSTCRNSHKLPAIARSSSSQGGGGAHLVSTRDPDLRLCNTIDDLIETAYDHLDTISPRGMAAFWSLLVNIFKTIAGGTVGFN